jgi:hypothetical protein
MPEIQNIFNRLIAVDDLNQPVPDLSESNYRGWDWISRSCFLASLCLFLTQTPVGQRGVIDYIPEQQLSARFFASGVLGEDSLKTEEFFSEEQIEALYTLTQQKIERSNTYLQLFTTEMEIDPALQYAILSKVVADSWSGVKEIDDYPYAGAVDFLDKDNPLNILRFNGLEDVQHAIGSFNYIVKNGNIVITDTFDSSISNQGRTFSRAKLALELLRKRGGFDGKTWINAGASVLITEFNIRIEIPTSEELQALHQENQNLRKQFVDWLRENEDLTQESQRFNYVVDDGAYIRFQQDYNTFDANQRNLHNYISERVKYVLSYNGVSQAHMLLIEESALIQQLVLELMSDGIVIETEEDLKEVLEDVSRQIIKLSDKELVSRTYERYGVRNQN